MNSSGFTLLETLLAMAIGSVMMIGAARTLPLLQQQNLRIQMQVQLDEELQQIMYTLEKFVRRAGYCHGRCSGSAVQTTDGNASCLLIRWDENSNGRWDGPESEESDYYGFRLRKRNLEMQRGVDNCNGSGWEKLNDPRLIVIDDFNVTRAPGQVRIRLSGSAVAWSALTRTVESWITADNLE